MSKTITQYPVLFKINLVGCFPIVVEWFPRLRLALEKDHEIPKERNSEGKAVGATQTIPGSTASFAISAFRSFVMT
jgi:hypothetical protein